MDRAQPALKVLRSNLQRLCLSNHLQVHSGAVATFLRAPTADKYDIVFLDPPYDASDEYDKALGLLGGSALNLLAPDPLVIAEHRRKDKLAEIYGALQRKRLLQQGDAALSFYAVQKDESATPEEEL